MEKGDSGGPLMVKDFWTQHYLLMGIPSMSLSWHESGFEKEGVYTRVPNLRPWILDKTRDAKFCGSSPNAGNLIDVAHCPMLTYFKVVTQKNGGLFLILSFCKCNQHIFLRLVIFISRNDLDLESAIIIKYIFTYTYTKLYIIQNIL